jgi:hypothetical protein
MLANAEWKPGKLAPSKVPSTTAVPLKSGAGCWTRAADMVDVVVVMLWGLGMMGR